MSGYDPYGYDFPASGASRGYQANSAAAFDNQYESFASASVSALPSLITRPAAGPLIRPPAGPPNRPPAGPPKVGFNYNKNRSGKAKLLILQEDLEGGATPNEAQKAPLLSLNHSTKRPPSDVFYDAKYKRCWSPEKYPAPGMSGTPFVRRQSVGMPPGSNVRQRIGTKPFVPNANQFVPNANQFVPKAKKVKQNVTIAQRSVANRHPAQAIKEKYNTAEYTTIGKNSFHEKLQTDCLNRFIICLTIPGKSYATFIGSGPNERSASHEASYNAILFLKPFGWENIKDHLHDKVKDEVLKVREFRSTFGVKKCLPDSDVEVGLVKWITEVYEPHAEVSWKTEQICNNRSHNIIFFKAELTIGKHTVVEVATTEDNAKELAAKTCIMQFEAVPPSFMMTDIKVDLETGALVNKDEEIELVDRLMIKVNQLLWKKTKDIQAQSFVNLRNTAALILQDGDGESPDDYDVICVATGLGSLPEKKLTKDGTVVHDLHAEILAIRAFRLYLFKQLEAAIDGDSSILAVSPQDEAKYSLKPCYKVILLKNIPPPGDCHAIDEADLNKSTKKIPASSLLGSQTKPGSLQFQDHDGTYQTEDHFTKTNTPKPAIASPSDKLSLTSFVGIQGGLLSQFLDPVYIDKCYFGSALCYRKGSITRGLGERLEAGVYKVLPPYKIHKPEVGSYSRRIKDLQRFENDQLHGGWALSDGDWEILKYPEGKALPDTELPKPVRRDCVDEVEYYQKKLDNARTVQGLLGPSGLTKQAMFRAYTGVCNSLGRDVPGTYFACKALSYEYHSVKISAANAFKKASLGSWPLKTVNTESFTLTDSDQQTLDLVKN